MKLDLTPRQVEALRGSISRALIDMLAECDDDDPTDYCRLIRREASVLQRVRENLNGKTS